VTCRVRRLEAGFPGLAAGSIGARSASSASMGGQTAAMLFGARLTDPQDSEAHDVNVLETRIKAGVLLTIPGNGGESLSEAAAKNYTFFNPDFAHMTTRNLVVVGSEDASPHLTVRGHSLARRSLPAQSGLRGSAHDDRRRARSWRHLGV
jgi:hypothetical protein